MQKRIVTVLALVLATPSIVLFPCSSFAATDCRVVEFVDHVEAICVGDPRYKPTTPEPSAESQNNTTGAAVSKRRQNIELIREMNAHRLDPVESQKTSNLNNKKQVLLPQKDVR